MRTAENVDELFSEGEEYKNHRAAALNIAHTGGPTLYPTREAPAKEQPSLSDNRSALELWTPQHVAFLDQHIFLGESAKAEDAFTFINEKLVDLSGGFKNFRVFPEQLKTVGYFLDETREGCYRIQMFTYNGKTGVNCTRLDGDSLALCSLWKALKQSLHEGEFYVDEFIAEGDFEDDDDIFGDEDETLDMEAFKYLDFCRDEDFVKKMVEDVTDLNVGTHALMLLKFNLEKEQNKELVVEKFAQNLFDKTVDRLSGQSVSLPDAVCAAHILSCLVLQANIAITVEKLGTLIDATEYWSCENNDTRTIVPTASEEAALLLTELLPTALKQFSEEDKTDLEISDRLNRIVETTNFPTVSDAGATFGSN